MSQAPSLRDRQAPLKEQYQRDPVSAQHTFTVRSVTSSDDPTRVEIATDEVPGVTWNVGAHPYAAGDGELPCSGDVFLASLAACQEITLRMVAAAMGITLTSLDLQVHGEMDFLGTMGIDPETPVGFTRIRTEIRLSADAPPDRLERLVQRAERYCVIASTLRQPPALESSFTFV